MNSNNGGNHQASKPAPPDPTWTYTDTGVQSGSYTPLDDGQEEQRVITGTRAYFDKFGSATSSFVCDVLKLTYLMTDNKRIEKAVTTFTKKVIVTILFDADSRPTNVDSGAPPPPAPGPGSPAIPIVPPATSAPSPAVVVAAALAAQGPGYRSRNIDQFFIPHGSSRSTSSARTIVRLRARGNEQPAASGSGSSSSAPASNREGIHGPRPRPLHILTDDDEAQRPTKKRKRDAF